VSPATARAVEFWAEIEVVIGTTDETVGTILCFDQNLQGVTEVQGSHIENIFT
jgi:hypothetical protein